MLAISPDLNIDLATAFQNFGVDVAEGAALRLPASISPLKAELAEEIVECLRRIGKEV